jgi:hypothetical protein
LEVVLELKIKKDRFIWSFNANYFSNERRIANQGRKAETLPRISI